MNRTELSRRAWRLRGLGIALVLLTIRSGELRSAGEGSSEGEKAEAARRHFARWAESIAQLPSVHFVFQSTWRQKSPHDSVVRGSFDFDARSGAAYLEYTSSPIGTLPKKTSHISWRDGIGLHLVHDPEKTQQKIVRRDRAPKEIGHSFMASSHPCFPGLRSLATHLERPGVRVERLAADDALYRIAVPGGDEASASRPSWDIYIVDPDSPDPLREHRVYFAEVPKIAPGLEAIPEEYALPDDYRMGYLHFVRRVTEYGDIEGRRLPIAWSLRSPAQKFEVELEIHEESLSLAGTPAHNYSVPIGENDFIVDLPTRMTFEGTIDSAPVSEVDRTLTISEARLDGMLRDAGVEVGKIGARGKEITMPSGCSANCLYLALRAMGRRASLAEILRGIGLKPGEYWASLAGVGEYLRRRGIESAAVEAETELLRDVGATAVSSPSGRRRDDASLLARSGLSSGRRDGAGARRPEGAVPIEHPGDHRTLVRKGASARLRARRCDPEGGAARDHPGESCFLAGSCSRPPCPFGGGCAAGALIERSPERCSSPRPSRRRAAAQVSR